VDRHLRRWAGVINKNEFVEVLDSSVSVVTRIRLYSGFDPGGEHNFFLLSATSRPAGSFQVSNLLYTRIFLQGFKRSDRSC
jgi:hypothetical protein